MLSVPPSGPEESMGREHDLFQRGTQRGIVVAEWFSGLVRVLSTAYGHLSNPLGEEDLPAEVEGGTVAHTTQRCTH